MKRAVIVAVLALLTLSAQAQKVSLQWGVRLDGAMINDEFDASEARFAESGTLAAVKFSPRIGLKFGKGSRLFAGATFTKDFGTPGMAPATEWSAWYQFDKKNFTLAAGIFPRTILSKGYSTLILSDAVRFYDTYLEGFALRWKKNSSFAEIVLDWNGKYGEARREQFNVISAGKLHLFVPMFLVGWEGMFHHYACSREFIAVVDDHIIRPYVGADFASITGMQSLSAQLGVVAGYQKDRLSGMGYTPFGVHLLTEAGIWNFGIRNTAYYGDSQAPLYAQPDEAGNPYASALYMRASIWQKAGFYDRAELYWAKSIGRYAALGVSLVFHFGNEGYIGCQQLFRVAVNLDDIKLK